MLIKRITLCLMLGVTAAAYAQVDGLGQTEFANSGAEEAQEPFLRGLLLLHSFEYEDAREAFAEARKIDKDFAMAYWGEAMSYNHPVWFTQETKKGRAVLEALGSTLEERLERAPTAREKDYLRAVEALFYSDDDKNTRDFNYMAFMERMADRYPNDLDARAFYALSLIGCSHGGRNFTLYMKAAAAGETVFARNPQHPGAAHYLIHSYDDPVHAPLGLRAARVYSEIAPSAAHALHMPTHIFTALGMWQRVVDLNEKSYQAAEQRRLRKELPLTARSYHAIHWKTYGLLQQSRFEEAREAILSVHSDVEATGGKGRTRSSLALMRAAYLIDTDHWDSNIAAITLDGEKLGTETRANHLFVEGMMALKHGDLDAAFDHVKQLMDLEGKGKGRTIATILQHELKSLLLLKEGNPVEAVKLLREAAAMEDAMPFDFGPPSPVKPSHELLGEILLAQEDYEGAQAAFTQALARAPKRARALRGLAAAAKGAQDMDVAKDASRTLKEITPQADFGTTKGKTIKY